jgi:hypothetical protein
MPVNETNIKGKMQSIDLNLIRLMLLFHCKLWILFFVPFSHEMFEFSANQFADFHVLGLIFQS